MVGHPRDKIFCITRFSCCESTASIFFMISSCDRGLPNSNTCRANWPHLEDVLSSDINKPDLSCAQAREVSVFVICLVTSFNSWHTVSTSSLVASSFVPA